jgi:hypothetical protein
MADRTERVSDDASGETDDALEWLPHEIEQELRGPLFQRRTTDERAQRTVEASPPSEVRTSRRFEPQVEPVPKPAAEPVLVARPVPSAPREARRPAIGPEMSQRIAEVEAAVAKAARAIDRSASNVRTLVERKENPEKARD